MPGSAILAPWRATYRLQLHAGFPLAAAAEVLPYLRDLGISHVYLSPCFQAAPGSTHGYDGADPSRVSDDLGGEPAWDQFVAAARQAGLGILLDIVPNHMTTDSANPWWDDVLAHGPFSPHAATFDLFPFANGPRWQVAISVLGQAYGRVLEAGEISIDVSSGLPRLRYFEQSWPLTPASWRTLLTGVAPDLAFAWPELARLQANAQPNPAELSRYRALAAQVTERTRSLLEDAVVREAVQARIDELAARPAELHAIIDEQFYRLAWWKLEGEIVNYRRFFNVGTLVGVRMESPAVFESANARIWEMIAANELAGLRVDHPDGLRDPREYFERLRARMPEGRIYAEKILDAEETLPDDWPIDGSVGYEFLSKVNRLWMDESKADTLTIVYADFTGHPTNYPALVRAKKDEILATHFATDLDRLVSLAVEISQARYQTHDLSRGQMRRAIALVIVALPVYRTYFSGSSRPASVTDVRVINDALVAARAQAPEIEAGVFEFLNTLLGDQYEGPAAREFVARFQQLSPAVMAKGVEDTSFYLYDRFIACNEVGSQPSALGISAEKFHQFLTHLQTRWPGNLLPTSTHDNKRSEDVRARLNVISEIPDAWDAAVRRWAALNHQAWRGREPDRHAEYMFYQTLVGAWPISPERAWAYLLKACREAKVRTSWHEPNAGYEDGLREFVEGSLANAEFLAALEEFVRPLIEPGRINSLAQTLIKLTAAGTPDFYQGTEIWDLSLVDPDNRRPVDFEFRRSLLHRAKEAALDEVNAETESGLPKLWLIQRTLEVRQAHPDCFAGDHQPLSARGSKLGHVFGYRRGENVVVLVPRFTHSLGGNWADTIVPLPDGRWRSVFTGEEFSGDVSPAQLLADFPVSLLTRIVS